MIKKVYEYDVNGYYVGEGIQYNEMLPHNSTQKKPPAIQEGFLIKWNEGSWEYEEIPKEEAYTPTRQDLLNQLNAWLAARNNEIANHLLLDLSSGLTLKESQAIANEDSEEIVAEYAEKLVRIQAGENPFEEVQ